MSCVVTSTKEFKDAQKKYNLSEDNLRDIVYEYQNKDGFQDSFPDENYIRERILGKSMIDATKEQIEIWKKYFSKPFVVASIEEQNKLYSKALEYFNEESVIKSNTLDGKYRVAVAVPYTKEYIKEIKEILKNAPRDSEGRLLAPNGKPSNLTEKQYVQVRTKAFINWFGDWINDPENASKVVDENGEPLVVYHGSPNKNIEIFNTKEATGLKLKKLEDLSIPKTSWFTEERIARETYSITPESFGTRQPEYGKTYPVFLNIKNPVSDGLKNAEEIQEFWGTYVKSDETIRDLMQRVHNSITENTDGFILRFEDRDADAPNYTSLQTQYGITNPNQAKSADANIGTYLIEDANLYHEQIIEKRGYKFSDTNLNFLFNTHVDKTTNIFEASVPVENIINILFSSEYSNVMSLLQSVDKDIFKDIKIQLVSTALSNRRYEGKLGTDSKRAYYDAAEKTIYINVDGNYANGNASSVIMHEILHAITVDKILSNPDKKQAFIDIMNQYNAYVNNLDRRYIKSPIESKDQTVEEFVANIWSDPKTIEILKEIKVDNSDLTLWDKIKQFFTDLFAGIFEGTTENSLMAKASEEMIRLLESPTTTESTEKFNESIKDNTTKFTTSKTTSYAKRTRENVGWSDITLALATDFNTAGEKLTKTVAGYKYVSSNINDSVDKIVSSILKQINIKGLPVKNIKLNVAGNGIYSLKSFSQEKVNNLVTEVIKGLQKAGITISEIRSGGQTGIDEAGIIAAQRLNIPNSVHTTSDWKFRDSSGKDISDETAFKERFSIKENKDGDNINLEVLDKSKAIIEEIIADSKENIKKHKNFDEEDVEGSHTYLIKIDGKWVSADYSVTQLINGNIDLGAWKLPSTKIGNTTDKFVRDYFQLEPSKRKNIVRRSYPNLTMEHKKDFFTQMQKLEAYFDSIYGKGHYRVETREFPISGRYYYDEDGTTKYYNIAGTMDMIVYDDEGNIDIYDVKTVRSGIDKSKQEKYTKQLSIYKAILEANYPELRGKIKNLSLIRFDVKYPKPSDVLYTTMDTDKDTLYISEDSDLEFKELKYFDSDIYNSPKLNSDYIIPLSPYSYEDEIKSLTEEEKDLVEEEMKKEEKETFETSKNNLYNNPLLTASERRFLADNVMNYVSFIVSNLQSDSKSNSYYFDNKYSQYDFTSMSRNEILNIPGVLSDIFYYIKEAYYNPDNRDDIEDFDILDKLQVAYDNWEELVKSGYSRLITLEGITVYDVLPEDIKTELTDVDNDYNLDSANLEEKEREYWQIGIRNISAKASLSKDIRRLFEKLEVVDSNGESVLDSFGFGFKTFVNSDEAVNSILSWCSECTNMEEMEKMLQTYEENNPWLTPILEKIKEEPIRSQFFQNFRKDFTQYSIVLTETDSKGNTIYKTLIINTKGVSKVMLEGVTNAYTLGLLTDIIKPIKGDIEGRGSVNVTKVKTLNSRFYEMKTAIKDAYTQKTVTKTIKSLIKELVPMLNSLGVSVDSKILKDAFALDKNKKNYEISNIYKVVDNLFYLTQTLVSAENETAYNPVIKGEKYNVYGNYKNTITILSKYIQDSIESSSYENGKMHYSFVTPSYMGKLVTNLKNAISDTNKFKKFIEDEYKSYKWFYSEGKWLNDWLKQLSTQSDARENFDHKVQLAFDDVPYTELSELNYALSLIHEYFYDKNGKLAWYRVPILANKPSSEFIKFTRYTGTNYQKDIKRRLGNVLTQEISRIKTVLERSYNPNVNKIGVKEKVTYDIVDSMLLNSKGKLDTNLIKRIKKGELTIKDFIVNGKLRFENSGASFKFLPALNNEFLNETELAQLIVDKINGKEVNEERLTKLFNGAIDVYMAMIVSKELNYYESLGMFDIEKKKDNSSFKYLNQLGNSIEEIKGNLTEYIWNDMFATINIIQLTATDLAYYKNVEEFQKRYSQVHAPTLKFNTTAVDSKGVKYSADAKTRTIYLKDSIVVSEIISNVTKIFEDKIKTLSGTEKEHMRMMKDLIISSFEDINVADAQAYSSPTSYRKKMGMQGKWTTEMEKAYERIKSGNYNVNDLGVVWQPLKPFVYSQIRKSSGASTMSEIKVPVQNKNSEYLLILADALMRSGNQVSKLTAIFDFMEESAYDGRIHKDGKIISEGVYNGKGIDTVQFESAVNSGSMGAIDINELSSYEDIKQALHEAVYYNSDKSESSDNNDDRYNDQYVHTISFEDYGIQQEVPAHFIDHEQLMGSQIRILSISDITPGTKFTIRGESIEDKQLIQEYQELHAQNIRESFKDLVDEFNIKGTKLQKNKALERVLQDAILKDQRYGADLLRACTLNEQEEFTIPLYDPIQSIRIQQLINSIIKSRINKQKISGGPVVQTSVFGMSDDLKIVWEDKDKGIVKHFECYMPMPSKELEELMTRYDSNGNAYFISLDEAVKQGIVPEEMRKAIGYRIPTEDKYSMVPLYIKGFLPKAAGESIMLPKEITKLSGSDFDIDKMYIMLKAFKKQLNYKRVEDFFRKSMAASGKSKKEIDKFIYGDKISESSLREYLQKIEQGVVFSTFKSTKDSEYKEDEKGNLIYDVIIAGKNNFYTFKEETNLNTRHGRNNRILDLQWAVLTSKDTMDKMFNPGSFDVQKKTARIITILKNSSEYTYSELSKMKLKDLNKIINNLNLSILHPSTQIYFHKQNMTAGKLIGIFANNNTSHAFISLQDIYLNVLNEWTFNGVTVSNEGHNKLDALRGKDGSLISKTIAGFLAASVDAVKDPVLNHMNLNTFTANIAMLLARLGFDTDSIGLFLTQPIIEKVTQEYFKRSNEGYTDIDSLIKDFIPESIDINALSENLSSTQFTKDDLAEGIREGVSNSTFQYMALLLFKNLHDTAQDLNTLTFLTKFNSVTNAVGPTIADTLVLQERYKKFMDRMESDVAPFSPSAIRVLENSPILNAFYDTTISDSGASRLIFEDYFPHYSPTFSSILDAVRSRIKGNLTSKQINKLVNAFVMYKLTLGENSIIDGSYDSRKHYIIDFIREFSKASEEHPDNALLKVFKLVPRSKKCPVSTLEAKTGGYSIDLQETIKNAWSNLMLNPKTNKLGSDLFIYNILRSGFSYSPKTAGHLASVDVKLGFGNYVETIRDPKFNDREVLLGVFINQFLRNNTSEYSLVPRVEFNKKTVQVKETKGKLSISFDGKKSSIDNIITSASSYGTIYAPVIIYNDKVYMNPKELGTSVVYTETTPLGNTNNFVEYDGNDTGEMKSVLKQQVYSREKSSTAENTGDYRKSWTTNEIMKILKAEFGEEDYEAFKDTENKAGFVNSIIDELAEKMKVDPKNETFREKAKEKLKKRIEDFC